MTAKFPRLVAVMAVAALLMGACSSKSDTSAGGSGGTGRKALPPCPLDALAKATAPVEVVAWHIQSAKNLDTLKELVDTYNSSQSKVKIRLESQGASTEELNRKFNAAVASKQLPGLVMFDDTSTESMASSGVILPAQSCIDADRYDMSDFVKVAVDYYTVDGAIWPGSANLANALIFYNKNHFRRAGLDPEKPPQTLAEVRSMSEKIKAAGVTGTPFVHEFASWKTEFWLTGAKASVVNNGNGRGSGTTDAATLAGNPQATELFLWFKQMQADGLMEAIPNTEGQINQYLALAQQKASMAVESTGAATSVEAFLKGDTSVAANVNATNVDVSGLDIGAGLFPGMKEPGATQMGGQAWYMTNTGSPEVQAGAWDFLKFLNTAESQAKLLIGGSYLPYRKSTNDLPQVKAFYNGSQSGKWLAIANDELNKLDPSFPGPLIGPYYEFRQAIRKAQDDLMFNNKSPEEALQQAQTQVDGDLKTYNRETR